MTDVAKVNLMELFGGEQATAAVRFGDGIIEFELWQDRVEGEEPYNIWLGVEGAQAIVEVLQEGIRVANLSRGT